MKALLLILLFSLSIAHGYDTGHHADLTRNALQLLGYNAYAQDVAAVSNWMVDYFSYTLDVEDIVELNSLHFDNLFTLQNVSNYLTRLVNNTRGTVITAVQNNDALTYLSIIGSTLHAYQDFYTHSSWAESHQSECGCYRDDTWFSALAAVNGNVSQLVPTLQGLSTYSYGDVCDTYQRNCFPGQIDHGDYCGGINKDSYVRPYFEASYGFGFAGSIEWIYNIEQWAKSVANGEAVIQGAKNYTPPTQQDINDLKSDVQASITVSYATKTPFEDDGHWKGPGSGNLARFAQAGVDFIKSSSIYKKQFTEKKFWETIVNPPLYDVDPTVSQEYSNAVEYIIPYAAIPFEVRNFTKIKVRTTSLSVPDRINTPSPYAIVIVDGIAFEEAVQIDENSFSPFWTTIKFVHGTTRQVSIKYTLYNDKFPSDDEQLKIVSDADGSLDVTFDVFSHGLTGDATGVHDTLSTALTTTADENSITLFITQQKFGGCNIFALPDPFCEDEAYTALKVHPICDAVEGIETLSGASSVKVALTAILALIAFVMTY